MGLVFDLGTAIPEINGVAQVFFVPSSCCFVHHVEKQRLRTVRFSCYQSACGAHDETIIIWVVHVLTCTFCGRTVFYCFALCSPPWSFLFCPMTTRRSAFLLH